jgi:hypothetical protein
LPRISDILRITHHTRGKDGKPTTMFFSYKYIVIDNTLVYYHGLLTKTHLLYIYKKQALWSVSGFLETQLGLGIPKSQQSVGAAHVFL